MNTFFTIKSMNGAKVQALEPFGLITLLSLTDYFALVMQYAKLEPLNMIPFANQTSVYKINAMLILGGKSLDVSFLVKQEYIANTLKPESSVLFPKFSDVVELVDEYSYSLFYSTELAGQVPAMDDNSIFEDEPFNFSGYEEIPSTAQIKHIFKIEGD